MSMDRMDSGDGKSRPVVTDNASPCCMGAVLYEGRVIWGRSVVRAAQADPADTVTVIPASTIGRKRSDRPVFLPLRPRGID